MRVFETERKNVAFRVGYFKLPEFGPFSDFDRLSLESIWIEHLKIHYIILSRRQRVLLWCSVLNCHLNH